MRPALVRGLTLALLLAGSLGALRLPATLVQAPANGRADVVVPASIPSHVVRLPAPESPVRRRSPKPAKAPALALRALPAQAVTTPAAPRTAPAKPRVEVEAPVAARPLRIVRAEPSVAIATPASAPIAAPAPAPEPVPVAVLVAAVTPAPAATQPEDRDNRRGKEKKQKSKRDKRQLAAAPAAVQILSTSAPAAPPVLEQAADVSGEEDTDDDDAERGKNGREHKREHGHDKRD